MAKSRNALHRKSGGALFGGMPRGTLERELSRSKLCIRSSRLLLQIGKHETCWRRSAGGGEWPKYAALGESCWGCIVECRQRRRVALNLLSCCLRQRQAWLASPALLLRLAELRHDLLSCYSL